MSTSPDATPATTAGGSSTSPGARAAAVVGGVVTVGIITIFVLGGRGPVAGADADSMIVGDTIVLDVLDNDTPNDAPITSVSFASPDAVAEIVDGGADGRDTISFTSDVPGEYLGSYVITVDGEEATGNLVVVVDPAADEVETQPSPSDEPTATESDAVAEPSPAPSPTGTPEPDTASPEPATPPVPTATPTPRPSATPTPTPQPTPAPTPTATTDPVAANRPPVAADDTAASVAGDSVTVPVLSNDRDPDGDSLSLVSVSASGPGGPSAVISSGQVAVTTPQAGTVTVTYRVTDGSDQDTGTLTVTVSAPQDDPPVAVADSYAVGYGSVSLLPVIGNSASDNGADQDEDRSTLRIAEVRARNASGNLYSPAGSSTNTGWGTASITSDGRRIEYSAVGFAGGAPTSDSFEYRIRDAAGQLSDWVRVTIQLSS
jgi:outer membrane biosynthesis protein TonB